MKRFWKRMRRLITAEDGPTAVEYAMVLMLVFLVCLSAITLFGQRTSASFQDSSTSLQEALHSG